MRIPVVSPVRKDVKHGNHSMKIIKVLIIAISASGLLAGCDTDRYANQPTVIVTESEDPEFRKALIRKLNAVDFDYEITRNGDIRFPRSNRAEFDAILAEVTREQAAGK
jgi:hypothetical protein